MFCCEAAVDGGPQLDRRELTRLGVRKIWLPSNVSVIWGVGARTWRGLQLPVLSCAQEAQSRTVPSIHTISSAAPPRRSWPVC